tara:strand:+ start:7230 stop:7535 length:306 start_codon:yes stop_codon:yes gene_type:complete
MSKICKISGLELPHRILSLKELKNLASNMYEEGNQYAIHISYSVETARSNAAVFYDIYSELWEIFHPSTGDSEEQLTTSEFLKFTPIGTALNKSSLYYEGC